MNVLWSKFKESLYAVLPITLIVILLHFTISPLDLVHLTRFVIGAFLIVFGLSIFLVGVDVGITPIGQHMGVWAAKSNKVWIVLVFGLLLGFFISIAEPDLHILAGQVDMVTSGGVSKISLVVIVSIGIGLLIGVGLLRIVFNYPLYKLLLILYGLIFVLCLFSSPEFLAISFDASGATTGALTVPFILALAVGISSMKKDSKAGEKDSFGLVAIASTGAIITVLIMSIVSRTDELSGALEAGESAKESLLTPFFHHIPQISKEILIALLPVVLIFLVFQIFSFRMSRKAVRRIITGVVLTFVGLVMFLVGVNAGFMEVGTLVGHQIAMMDSKLYLLIVGFILGLVTILAEPAVHVLTHQIEDVTSGYVKRSVVLLSLSLGVGLAVALSVIRVLVPDLQLWHYLLPGYMIALAMTFFVPKLFVGIAFDSGGVASGPMTATFILAFIQGTAAASEGANVLVDGFGMIAMVALTPLIALQVLGLLFKMKTKKDG